MAYILDAKHPVLKAGVHRITSPFGMRVDPITHEGISMHYGIDMTGADRKTDDIIAFEDGIVIFARDSVNGDYTVLKGRYPAGNYVVIQHINNYKTRYLHMAFESVVVKKGDTVKKGDLIGHMGSTGNSTGDHLHFEVQLGNIAQDPEPYLLGLHRIAHDPMLGDLNQDGDIDAVDYLYVKRSILGTYNLSDRQKAVADIDGDGELTIKDYLKLKRAVLGTYEIEE